MSRILAQTLACGVAIIGSIAPVNAQIRTFQIPSGQLGDVLHVFSRQVSLQLLYQPADVAEVRSPGVAGAMSTQEALKKILSGTGFSATEDATGAVAVARTRQARPTERNLRPKLIPAAMQVPVAEEPTADAYGLADIVVTAQKRSESANKVPLSINVASGLQLKELGVRSASDLAKVATGFIAVNSIYSTPIYYLRGVGYADTSLAARPTVSIYSDEAPLPYSIMALGTTLDLERVEVLKGPQGTLFGSNSTGGAINFIAAKPTDHLSYGASISYGRFNATNIDGFVSGPVSDNVRVRLAASHEGASDWQKSYTRDATNGSKNITSGRLTVDVDASSRLKLRLTASGTVDRSDTQAPQLIGKFPKPGTIPPLQPEFAAYPLSPRGARFADWSPTLALGDTLRKHNSQWQVTLRGDYELDWATLTSLSSYVRNRQNYGSDADGTSLHVDDIGIDGTVKSFTQEVRAAGTLGSRGRWITGANLELDRTHEISTFDLAQGNNGHVFDFLGLPPNDPVPVLGNTKVESKAVFANFDYDLGSSITVHGGIRYTDVTSKFNGCALSFGNRTYPTGLATLLNIPVPAVGDCVTITILPDGTFKPQLAQLKLSEHNVSWRAGIDWKPLADTLIYGSVSRGYKAGSFSNIAAPYASQYVPATQEQLTAYEVGFKSAILSRKLQVNGAVFYYDYRDKQVQGTVPTPIFGNLQALINVPKSSIWGAELQVTARPIEGLTVSGSGSYLSTKVIGKFENLTVFGQTADFANANFPNTPKWQANASANYTFPLGSKDLRGFIGSNLTYRSRSNSDFIPAAILTMPGYALVDARLGIEDKSAGWQLEIWGRNLTNKNYSVNTAAFLEAIVRYTGQPISYGVKASYQF